MISDTNITPKPVGIDGTKGAAGEYINSSFQCMSYIYKFKMQYSLIHYY